MNVANHNKDLSMMGNYFGENPLKLFFFASFIPFKKIPKVNKYIIKNTNSQVAGFVSGLCNLYFTISRRPPRIH